jgi:hypothetical protein
MTAGEECRCRGGGTVRQTFAKPNTEAATEVQLSTVVVILLLLLLDEP